MMRSKELKISRLVSLMLILSKILAYATAVHHSVDQLLMVAACLS